MKISVKKFIDKPSRWNLYFSYFPSNHVTLEDLEPRGSTPIQAPEVTSSSPRKPESGKSEVTGKMCVALYPYTSEEPGDLPFEVNCPR